MENIEVKTNIECETPQKQSLPPENDSELTEKTLQTNDNTDTLKITDSTSNSENQTSVETTDVSSDNTNVTTETNSVVPSDNSMPPLPPLPNDDKGQLAQTPAAYSADYNMQNYANYNYMYNYNNYYGYPYPQYQWDYNSQQYYQPYQNYYNYNYNSNQTQASKPPPPPPNAVQLPVEEKPANKSNTTTVDDSNRYSPTAETDDDDTMKGLSENNKSDVHNEQPPPQTTTSFTNSVPSEQTELKKNMPESESVDNKMLQPIFSSVTPEQQPIVPLIAQIQQPIVPLIAQIQQYSIPVQQPSYSINPQIQMQSKEANNESNQLNPPTLNGKDDSTEKVSKGSTVLGKTQAKKRLMAFSMMKQKLLEQNNLNNDNPSSDIGEGNDVEFVPELNVFQTVPKKKVVTNKKVAKVIKAQQTIEQIEEMKKDELLQGNNAALYQHLLRSGGNEAPILQKLGIESLAEKYSAKIREQDKRMKRHHHRRRDDNRRSHKYRRRSHSKSRSRSRSAEKPKMRALEVKSWKDFVNGGFHFDRFRRFKLDEIEELKEKERKSRSKKRHNESRSDGKSQNIESGISTEVEKGNADQNLRYNILDYKKEIRKGLEVVTFEADTTKDFPSYIIRYTKTKPVLKYSENPSTATYHLQNRQQMLATLLPEIEIIVRKFLSEMKPKKLKENTFDDNYTYIDEKLLIMMKDKNIYPFKGWWPKTFFIITQVKENPNIEIDKDALINQFTTSKRTKKSRFDDDTSLVDIRPTVPSKWDSDYDGSPATEKVVDVEVPQNLEINTNDEAMLSLISNTEKINPSDISHQEEAMDTASDIGENDSKIEINVGPILPITSHEPQGHAKLDTEYEEFLKIVSAEKNDEKIANDLFSSTVEKEDENNQSVKSASLNDESVDVGQDDEFEDSSSSDESVSLHNIVDESMDTSFVKKLKKKKKSNKKSKKYKKKEGKKKKRKSSSSESSQVSESESDSSSEDSDSESTDSISSIEKKKKKKSKDKKKKKSKANYKKKHKGDKIKIKNPEEVNDNNSSILNLLEKAFNVEIKKRPLDHEELKQKKKKRKHKKDNKSNGENEDKFEKVKECLKETFTKLVKTDIVGKNQSLSCDDSTVNEVLKYFKIDDDKEKKSKKSKKNSKRKYDSDISDEEKITKKFKLEDSLKHSDSEKKKKSKKKKSSKKFNDSDEHILKKKSKKKSKTSDTSETEDGEGSKHKKSKNEKGTEHFFGLRPNEWNINNHSSMRGVVHLSDVKNTPPKSSEFNEIVNLDESKSLQLNSENLSVLSFKNNKSEIHSVLNNLNKYDELSNKLLKISDKNISNNEDNVSTNISVEKIVYPSNSDSEKSREDECKDENYDKSNKSDLFVKNLLEHKNNIPSTVLSTNDNYKQLKPDPVHVLKPTECKSPKQNNDSPILNTLIKPVGKTISYRDKVKMNLKKLSTCQHIPFVFGFSSPLNIIKSNNLKIEKIKESFDVLKEEVKPKLEESKHLKVDRPKVVICPQTQKKSNVANIIPPKIDVETDNKEVDRSFSWEDSDESNSDQSSVTSEDLSDETESDQIESSFIENDSLTKCNENQLYANEVFSNDSIVKDYQLQFHTLGMTKSNISSGSENKEQEQITEANNIVVKEKISTLLNSGDLSKYGQIMPNANAVEVKNESILVSTVCSEEKNSDSVYSQNSTAEEISKTDNELITQWKFDWNELNKSVIEINKSIDYSLDETMNLKLKKKSRWDDQPNEEMNCSQSFVYEEESVDKTSNYTYDRPKSTSSMSNDFLEDENLKSETTSIKSGNDSTEYNNCPETLPKDNYDDYSQSYEQYSCIPLYSDMKSIETNELSPVDYSLYENYNPNYEYCDQDYDMWKSVDSPQQVTSIPTTSDILPSSLQVGNVSEILHSDMISNEDAEFTNDEIEFSIDQTINNNIVTIIPDIQDEVVENEKSVSTIRGEQFVKLYEQYFQHYNQNPVKYSMSEPIIGSITEVDFSAPEKLSEEELSDTDQKIDKSIPIPLQQRGYSCLTKDNNLNLFLTSDNYVAYCAIEDSCMVHIAMDFTNRDGIEDEVRHCFNIYQNGTTIEYWLHADLIHFYAPSDAESGVFSDDEMDSLESDSGQEELITTNDDNEVDDIEEEEEDDDDDNNDNNDGGGDENSDMFVGEWEIVDSDSESNVDSWLDNPSIIEKYVENSIDVVGQTLSDLNQEECISNSSDYDSDISENSSDSNVESYSNKKPNITTNQLHNLFKDDENKSSNIIDGTNNDLEQTENTNKNVDIHVQKDDSVKLSDQLVTDVGNEKKIGLIEDITDSISDETPIKNHDSVSFKSEEKDDNKKESEIIAKGEVATEDILMMDTIIKQQLLIQRLKIRAKEKIQEKLPDTVMVQYSDNTETVKYPFLGLFQPPTISILSKQQCNKSNLSKRVTFADGILPGEDFAASPKHDDVGRPLSPPPLKALMREILKLKRNMYPFKRSKVRTKLTMVNKKVATVTPSIKKTTSSVIDYYVSQRRLEDLPIAETTVFRSDNSPNSDDGDHSSEKISTPPRPTRELTPVPSDNECWDDDDDDDNIKDDR